MELREIFQIIRKRILLMIIMIILAISGTYYFTKNSGTKYESSSILTVQAGREKTDQYQYGGYYSIQASDLFINTILGWVKSPNLIAEIYKNSDLFFENAKIKDIGKKIYARKVPPQNIILTITDKSPDESNKLAESTISLIKDKTSQLALVVNSSANFEIISSELIMTEIRPSIRFNLAIALIVSLILAIMIIFTIEYGSSTINSIQEIKKVFKKAPISIRNIRLRGLANPDTKEAEKFRFLRANIATPGEQNNFSIVVGGLNEQNMAPIIAANLALSFARSGKSTILIDACFSNPIIHDYFGRQNDSGFSEFLFDESNIEKYLQKTEEKNLKIISSGIKLSYASDTIERADICKVLKELEKMANVIIINVPALNLSSEALPLFALIKKALLIIKIGKTNTPTAKYINDFLERTGAEKHIIAV